MKPSPIVCHTAARPPTLLNPLVFRTSAVFEISSFLPIEEAQAAVLSGIPGTNPANVKFLDENCFVGGRHYAATSAPGRSCRMFPATGGNEEGVWYVFSRSSVTYRVLRVRVFANTAGQLVAYVMSAGMQYVPAGAPSLEDTTAADVDAYVRKVWSVPLAMGFDGQGVGLASLSYTPASGELSL